MTSNRLRLAFFGTPAFAVPSLQALHEAGYPIVAVVTAPDKPAGRGLQTRPSDVKQYALRHNLPVLQPERLQDPAFLERMKTLKPDLNVVVAFRMMPEALWAMPRLGSVNLHASLLPQYRGAAPIQRAVMAGETRTGLTTFFLQHEIDTGNVLFREETDIGPDETAGELHDRLMTLGADLLVRTVDAIASGEYRAVPQEPPAPGDTLKKAPKIRRTDCRIDWSLPAEAVRNLIRGLSPHPGAFAVFTDESGDGVNLKILRAARAGTDKAPRAGTLHTDGRTFLYVSASDGWLSVDEAQLPGKKRMGIGDLLRGSRMTEAWKTA